MVPEADISAAFAGSQRKRRGVHGTMTGMENNRSCDSEATNLFSFILFVFNFFLQ
jgi:hypothetical protein